MWSLRANGTVDEDDFSSRETASALNATEVRESAKAQEIEGERPRTGARRAGGQVQSGDQPVSAQQTRSSAQRHLTHMPM
jgi:hypothetical protein